MTLIWCHGLIKMWLGKLWMSIIYSDEQISSPFTRFLSLKSIKGRAITSIYLLPGSESRTTTLQTECNNSLWGTASAMQEIGWNNASNEAGVNNRTKTNPGGQKCTNSRKAGRLRTFWGRRWWMNNLKARKNNSFQELKPNLENIQT